MGVVKKWAHKEANIHVGLEHINVAKRGSAKYIAFLAQYYSLERYYVLSFISDSWLSANLQAAEWQNLAYPTRPSSLER